MYSLNPFLGSNLVCVKGGVKVYQWGGAKLYQQPDRHPLYSPVSLVAMATTSPA
jgi:hypothetical protein